MSRLRAPGVYFETANPPSRAIAEARTDIAGFVGISARGPLHCPVRVENWAQFRTRFGDTIPDGLLAYAVQGFFTNGGQTCWVVRAGVPPAAGHAARATLLLVNKSGTPVYRVCARDYGPWTEEITVRVVPTTQVSSDPYDRFGLVVSVAGDPVETWSNLIAADAAWNDIAPTQGLRFAAQTVNAPESADDPATATSTPVNGSQLIRLEAYRTPPPPSSDRLPVGVKLPGSATGTSVSSAAETDTGWLAVAPGVMRRELQAAATSAPDNAIAASNYIVPEGPLGSERSAAPVLTGLQLEHLTGENQPPGTLWGLQSLASIDEVGLVAMPDLLWTSPSPPPFVLPTACQLLPAGQTLPTATTPDEVRTPFGPGDQLTGQQAVIRHCACLRDRFGVLDVPSGMKPADAIVWGSSLRSISGQYAGLYYPWLYIPASSTGGGSVLSIPPSGHVAGVAARVDLSMGVQKPPANEILQGVCGLETDIDQTTHGLLNDESVNAIRGFPGRGIRISGARTLVGASGQMTSAVFDVRKWRFINVRRLLMMIEKSIDQATQWVVFQENNPGTWRQVDRVVRNFLDDEWHAGRLDGASADEAYQVTCDETTNTPADIAAGRLVCYIGVLPPAPAEFVIVRIGLSIGEDGTSGTGGLNGG